MGDVERAPELDPRVGPPGARCLALTGPILLADGAPALAILGEAAYSENCTAGQRLGLDRALAERVAGLEALLASPRGTGENSAP